MSAQVEGRGGSYKGVGRKGWVHGGGIKEAGQPCCHATMAMRPKKRQKCCFSTTFDQKSRYRVVQISLPHFNIAPFLYGMINSLSMKAVLKEAD